MLGLEIFTPLYDAWDASELMGVGTGGEFSWDEPCCFLPFKDAGLLLEVDADILLTSSRKTAVARIKLHRTIPRDNLVAQNVNNTLYAVVYLVAIAVNMHNESLWASCRDFL